MQLNTPNFVGRPCTIKCRSKKNRKKRYVFYSQKETHNVPYFLKRCTFTTMSNGTIGAVQKIEFEIRPKDVQPSKRPEKWFRTISLCVCVCVCVSVCPSVLLWLFSANSHGRMYKQIELKLQGHVRLYGPLRRINFCGYQSTLS